MTITLSPSGLRQHENTDTDWPGDETYNVNRLNNTLLKISGMGDVAISSIQNGDGLMWDSGASKYINHEAHYTTTTTSSSTSSTTTTTA